MAKRKLSDKPYPDFPLFKHATGQWAKKIRGRLRYFGIDPDAALAKYLDQKDALHAGRNPRNPDALTVRMLCNRFLTTKRLLMESGELSPRTWRDYYETCERMTAAFGLDRLVEDLAGDDFERHRAKLAKIRGPVSLGNEIQRVRTILKYAFDETLIDRPGRFGSTFRKPARKSVREAKHAAGRKMFTAAEVRQLIDATKGQLKAMILLGINCGFGPTDVGSLPLSALDLKGGWVNFPRPKTAVPRRVPLWKETVAALREATDARPSPKDQADAGLAFITIRGHRWVRARSRETGGAVWIDSVGLEFGKVLRTLGVKRLGVGFYSLRHSFRTAADGAKDQRATDSLMGHVSEHVSAQYVEEIEDKRLRAVTDHVRRWLLADAKKDKKS
jgi:integrase